MASWALVLGFLDKYLSFFTDYSQQPNSCFGDTEETLTEWNMQTPYANQDWPMPMCFALLK